MAPSVAVAPARGCAAACAKARRTKGWAVPTPGSRLGCAPSVMLRPREAVPQPARGPGAQRVGSAHTRLAIGLCAFGHATPAWGCVAACAKARRTEGAPGLQGSRLATGEARRVTCCVLPIRPGFRRDTFVGSAHTRLAIGLRAFGHATPAWGCAAACARARRTEGDLLRRPTEATQAPPALRQERHSAACPSWKRKNVGLCLLLHSPPTHHKRPADVLVRGPCYVFTS